MIKTQHCPNCEATEQKLHDFKQKVSDVAAVCAQHFCKNSWTVGDRQRHIDMLSRFIIPAPKPDLLVEAMKEIGVIPLAGNLRSALEARGLTITTLEKD